MRIARVLALLVSTVLLAGCSGGHDSPGEDSDESPFASPIRGLTLDQISDLENGTGMGLALAAELNGYPGPAHVLDLASKLGLNASQKATVQVLRDQAQAEARRLGADVLDLYRQLDRLFRDEVASAESVASVVEQIEALEADLRMAHLEAHIECYDVITPHQRALYMQLRGYGEADHGDHEH